MVFLVLLRKVGHYGFEAGGDEDLDFYWLAGFLNLGGGGFLAGGVLCWGFWVGGSCPGGFSVFALHPVIIAAISGTARIWIRCFLAFFMVFSCFWFFISLFFIV